MTPQDVMEACRQNYNAIGDTFWSDEEIYKYIHAAELEAATECVGIIERTYTTTTVAGTQEYSYPSLAVAIKRVTYDGLKLKKITMREDDAITGFDQDTTSRGTPQYFYEWNDSIFLRPIPNNALELKIFAYQEPDEVDATSTLEVPSVFHMSLVDYGCYRMAIKDSNFNAADRYEAKWKEHKARMKSWVAKRKRTESFGMVQTEEYIGNV